MMKKKSAGNSRQLYEERAEAIAAPIAEGFDIRIYDVEYVMEGEEYYLNVYIDKDGGVTIGDCENVSRLLSDALDREDLIPDAYTLIVSSPGLGRALTKDRHLSQSIGQDVEIHLYKPHAATGEKDIRGELLEFDDIQIILSADPPAAARGRGKGKGKGKEKSRNKKKDTAPDALAVPGKTTAEEIGEIEGLTDADPGSAMPDDEQQADQSGRQRLTVGRKEIASIRLAFDFE